MRVLGFSMVLALAAAQLEEMPMIGLGTAMINDPEVIKAALEIGYRHIDTALLYQNQEAVGEGLKLSGVPREEVWVTTKVGFFPPPERLKIPERVKSYFGNQQEFPSTFPPLP